MPSFEAKPFPLYEIHGSPLERGRSYGSQAKDRVRRTLEHYKAQVSRHELDGATISEVIRAVTPAVRKFDANYLDEMRGIAEGAGVSFEDIFFINARTEILRLALRPELRARLLRKDAPDGCTAVTVMPSASKNGELIHAQNWDWKVECSQTGVVLRIRREDGPDILTYTEAGMMARSGLNAAGIAITGNNLESDCDYTQTGVPLPMIRRKALECTHVAVAMHTVYTTPKSASNNMAVSHCDGIAINFECAPSETFVLDPQNGLLVHSNHWLSPVALGKLKDTGIAMSPCSLYRHTRVRELLAPHVGSITVDLVKKALLDDLQTPWSVCRPPRLDPARNIQTATVSTVVMQPRAGVMEVANLAAVNPEFTTYHLAAR
jgi:isopenicillin-N N-acyltransferase-like protein